MTATAGAVTVVNGAAEIGEGVTATNETSNDGYNFMRDGVLGGNAYAYDLQKNTFAAIAEVGTAVCTSYVSYKGSVCFVAGTMVLTEGGNIPIEDIEAGDYVYATNPEIGESGCKRVVQTFERETNELVKVTYKGETITTTPTHPFYSPQKGWTEAIELRAGDILVTCNGEYVVVEKVQHEILESPVTVYNFEVEDYHTYYVGDTSVLVHNKCRPDAPTKVSDQYIKRNNIDAHSFKDAHGIGRKYWAKYDIYKDTANKSRLWIGDKAGKVWHKTNYFLQDLVKQWMK